MPGCVNSKIQRMWKYMCQIIAFVISSGIRLFLHRMNCSRYSSVHFVRVPLIFFITMKSVFIFLLVSLCPLNSRAQLFQFPTSLQVEQNLFRLLSYATTFSDTEAMESHLTVPDLVNRSGYPIETHKVITKDGYVLELHRLPRNPACDNQTHANDTILLQHGVFMDSSNWVLTGPKYAFGYLLYDNCYDVWMGNNRGNRYSRGHTSLSSTDSATSSEYWNFSFHEMGVYDLPATVDYIIEMTGSPSIFFGGVSLSTTTFFVFLSERPEYNEKIRFMLGYGPAAYFENAQGPFPYLSSLAPFNSALQVFSRLSGVQELLPWPWNLIGPSMAITVCGRYSLTREMCALLCLAVTNFNPERVYQGLTADILRHVPAGGSVKSVIHLAQNIASKKFSKFDYGTETNRKLYNSDLPPEYNLTNIAVPVALFWGTGDWMSTELDVKKIANQLQNASIHNIDDKQFGHNDYVWGKTSAQLLYTPSMQLMNSYRTIQNPI